MAAPEEMTEIEVVEEFRGYEEDCPKMAQWVRLLARLGVGDLTAEAAEERADELELNGRGFKLLADKIEQQAPSS